VRPQRSPSPGCPWAHACTCNRSPQHLAAKLQLVTCQVAGSSAVHVSRLLSARPPSSRLVPSLLAAVTPRPQCGLHAIFLHYCLLDAGFARHWPPKLTLTGWLAFMRDAGSANLVPGTRPRSDNTLHVRGSVTGCKGSRSLGRFIHESEGRMSLSSWAAGCHTLHARCLPIICFIYIW
jgi:hypothetical protein